MRIGIFGGTFDPPHIAHQVLAAEALEQLGLDRLVWVLTPVPPHKQGIAISPVEQRLRLVRAAIAGEARFQLSRVELDRPGPHFAVDTVRLLQEQNPGDEFIYLLGGDSLRDLPLWYKPQEFVLRISGLGVMRRPGADINTGSLEIQLPGIWKKVRYFETPLLDISSTAIRTRIAEGRPFRYFLPSSVYELIRRNHYYQYSG